MKENDMLFGIMIYLSDFIGAREVSVNGEAGIWIPYSRNKALNRINGKSTITMWVAGEFKTTNSELIKARVPQNRKEMGVRYTEWPPDYPVVGRMRRHFPKTKNETPVEVEHGMIHETKDDMISI